MSGDWNYGGDGSGGFDINAFGDWGACTMCWVVPVRPRREPRVRLRQVYQPPHFDVDAYARPSASRYSQGLSQIREDYPDEPHPEGGRGGGSSRAFDVVEEDTEAPEEEEDGGRYPYSRKDTMAVYNAWISV